ncbi:MAG TPA: DNA-directed RNA polymerase subunit beta, partial [Spirochaetes bacterium]|nr:DNA-directed RNA polymerase subunit beta [Spirochaetota bacterium]
MLQTKEKITRKSLGRLKDVISIPDLIEIQLNSYIRFLQFDTPPEERNLTEGLEAVFRSTFPIESPNKDIILEYLGYSFGDIKYSEEESRHRDLTYSIVLKATIRLIYVDTGEVREKEVYMGDIPLMTERGTFIINGAERVVVSQIHKSPGVVFSSDVKENVYSAK